MRLELPAAELARAQDDDAVVGDDLDACLTQAPEQVLAPEVDLAADGVDGQADLDARGHLRRQRGQEGLADIARLVAVDEQVDVVGRRRDVLEHPREIAPTVEERLDGRADRRRERLGEVGAPDARTGDELRSSDGRVLGADRIRIDRVGRDAHRAPTAERSPGRGNGRDKRDVASAAHPRSPIPEIP